MTHPNLNIYILDASLKHTVVTFMCCSRLIIIVLTFSYIRINVYQNFLVYHYF